MAKSVMSRSSRSGEVGGFSPALPKDLNNVLQQSASARVVKTQAFRDASEGISSLNKSHRRTRASHSPAKGGIS